MDGEIEILLPVTSRISGLPFEIPYYEWDGIKYPQGPPECKFGSNFELQFIEHFNYEYIETIIPHSLRSISWQAISVQGNGPDIFIGQLHGFGKEEVGFRLRDLLETLLSKEPIWLAGFSAQYDGYSRIYSGDIENVIDYLQNPEDRRCGFLVCHHSI